MEYAALATGLLVSGLVKQIQLLFNIAFPIVIKQQRCCRWWRFDLDGGVTNSHHSILFVI